MPNKTIYVKEADLPILEQAQEQFGESISSMFAEFLRERARAATPEERRMVDVIEQLTHKRDALAKEADLPAFLRSEYTQAIEHAEQALDRLRAGRIKEAKIHFFAANSYQTWAERDVKQARELRDELATMLKSAGAGPKPRKTGK
jgi:hypothetical protein